MEQAEKAMRQILHRDSDADFMVEAALSGLYGRELSFLQTTLREWDNAPAGGQILAKLFAKAVTNEGDTRKLMQLASLVEGEAWWGRSILEGMNEGNTENLAQSPDVVRYLLDLPDEELRQLAARLVAEIERKPGSLEVVDLTELDEPVRALWLL